MNNTKTIIEDAFEQRSEITPVNVSTEIRQAVTETLSLLDNGCGYRRYAD